MFVGQSSIAGREVAQGARPTLGEASGASFEEAALNQSSLGFTNEFYYADKDNRERIKQATGEDIGGLFDKYQDPRERLEASKNFVGELDEDAMAVESRLIELQKQFPDIKTRAQIIEGIRKQAQENDAALADVQMRSEGLVDNLAIFAGAMAGSFTLNDPFNIATLGFGGAGKTVVKRIASEAGLGSVIETINQFTGVKRNREALGLDASNEQAFMNILAAGAGAGVLRGAFEAGAKGLTKYKQHFKKIDTTPIPAKDLIRNAPLPETTSDKAIDFALQREAMNDEILPTIVKPETQTMVDNKLQQAAVELMEGVRASDDVFPPLNQNAARVELANIADTFDIDIAKAEEYFQSIGRRADHDFTAKDILQLTGREPRALSEFIATVKKDIAELNKGAPRGGKKAGKQISQLEENLLKQEVYNAGYFPEKAKASEITKADLDEAIQAETQGQTRFAQADIDDALTARNAIEQRTREVMNIRKPENIKAQRQANIDYEASETAILERQLNELELKGDKASIQVERGDGKVEEIPLNKLRDEIAEETALLRAMKVCAI